MSSKDTDSTNDSAESVFEGLGDSECDGSEELESTKAQAQQEEDADVAPDLTFDSKAQYVAHLSKFLRNLL